MNITHIDASTGINTVTTVTKAEFAEIIGNIEAVKSIEEDIAENAAIKSSALAKLTALGLTEEEAKAITA